MLTKIVSSVTVVSERLNSLADTDRFLAKQDDLLFKDQAMRTVCSLHTRISYLQRRETTVTMKK